MALFFSIFSYFSAQKSIKKYEQILAQEISYRVLIQLEQFFVKATAVTAINTEQAEIGELNTDSFEKLQAHFITQIKHVPYLTFVSFGNAQGEYVGATRLPISNDINLMIAQKSDNNTLDTYTVTNKNSQDKKITTGKLFDATKRPWFLKAQMQKSMSWYSVYSYAPYNMMGIGVSSPIYDKNATLIGVFTADLALDAISDYLKTLNLGDNGVAFIAQEDGQLIASTSKEAVYEIKNGEFIRYNLGTSSDKRLNSVKTFWNKLDKNEGSLFLDIDNETYLLNQKVFKDKYGLSLRVGVMLAEKDYISTFLQDMKVAGIIMFLFILAALLILVKLSTRLAQPIEELNQHSKKISDGNFNIQINNNTNISELNNLGESFNTMSKKLHESFATLVAQSSFVNTGKAIANISHQYKTPLAHISLLTTSLEAYLFKTGNKDELLHDISTKMRNSLNFMSATMKNFNEFYQFSSKKEHFKIKEEINHILNMLHENIALMQVTIDLNVDSELHYFGYKSAFANVMMILIENSLDIFEKREISEAFIKISIAPDESGQIVIEVSDNGGGIEITPIDSIFETFVSSKTKSSGLGLAMCKTLVENRLDGKISVKNSADGALFKLVI